MLCVSMRVIRYGVWVYGRQLNPLVCQWASKWNANTTRRFLHALFFLFFCFWFCFSTCSTTFYRHL